MATLANLLVKLGVDPSGVKDGLAEAQKSFAEVGQNLKTVGLAAGAAGAAALGIGMATAISTEAAQDKLAAQLGGVHELSRTAGEAAGRLYANAYGGSLEEVNTAIRGVVQQGLVMEDATTEQIQAVTAKVLDLATAFDQDLGGVTAAVGQMIKTGLADNADEALDILTRGFEEGVDKAGDLLDTFTEYSTQFRKLGVDGPAAMGLLRQGLQAGARDADIVADAFKEFSIRAVDGSELTADSFRALGLDAARMQDQIAKGGTSAAKGLDTVLDRLRSVRDPARQAQIAVGLFGTQAEDLGAALFALDPSSAVDAMGQVEGAAAETGQTLADNAQTRITLWQRKFEGLLDSMITAPGVFGQAGAAAVGMGQSVLPMVSQFAMVGLAAQGMAGGVISSMASAVVSTTVSTAKMIGQLILQGARWAWLGVQALISATRIAAAWLISMGPIAIVIAAVVGLVALIVANWDTIKRAISAGWAAVQRVSVTVWSTITQLVSTKVSQIVSFVRGIPRKIGDLGRLLVDTGRDIARGLWSGLSSMGGWLAGQVMGWVRSVIPDPIERILGIASPSRVAAGIAHDFGRGMAGGLDASRRLVAASAARLAQAAEQQAAATLRAGTAVTMATVATPRGALQAAGGGGDTYIIEGSLITERELHDLVQRATVRYESRNARPGLSRRTG